MWETSSNKLKKHSVTKKMFWPFTAWTNCSSDLKIFANSRPSASSFKSFSRSLEQFFLTVGQNNFANKIPFFIMFQVQPSSLRHRHLLVKVLYPQLLLKQRLHLSQLLKTRLQCPHLQFWPNLRNQSALHLQHKQFRNQLQFCQKQLSSHLFQKLQCKSLKVAKLGIHFKRYVFYYFVA